MKIYLATSKDINRIMSIYKSAKLYMSIEHNYQWHDGYPGFKLIKQEIKDKELFVVKNDEYVVGCFALILGIDHTYLNIDGKWLNDEPYGTIHRLAKDEHAKGVLQAAVDFAFTKTKNIRIDTKNTNITMDAKLLAIGFKKCGIIKIDNGEDRVAYQMIKEK